MQTANRAKRASAIILLSAIAAAIALISSCAVGDTPDAEPIDPWVESTCDDETASYYANQLPGFVRDFSIAVAPTTRHMSTNEGDLEDAVSQCRALGGYLYLILSCSFDDPSANLYDYRRLVNLAERADMGISLALDISSLPNGATFADPAIRRNYIQEIEYLILERPPEFLNLCMEMNSYALDDTTAGDYPSLVSLYEEAYDLVEFLSPDTVTYCSHSWELDLLHAAEAPLQLLIDLGQRLDAAGISTFPQLAGIIEPAQIPGIYYTDLPSYVNLPVIVECGYSDDADFGGDENTARDFPPQLIRALGDLNLLQVQLVEMHDLPAEGLDEFFHGMGLRRLDGAAKPIYCGWQYIADAGS